MFSLDKIEPPKTFYYENKDGNEVPFNWNMGFPDFEWTEQHSKGVVVQHTICFAGENRDNWAIRSLKWIIRILPNKWKRQGHLTFNCTINHDYPIIKYLVENRKFKFGDACVVVSELCGRCNDIVYSELNGTAFSDTTHPHMHCKYCNVIDPAYSARRKLWCCYRTFKLKGDVEKAWKENSVYGSELTIVKWWHKYEIFTFIRRLFSAPKNK